MLFFTNLFKKNNDNSSKVAIHHYDTDVVSKNPSFINQLFRSSAKFNIYAKISRILDRAAFWLELFELEDFISKHSRLTKFYGYFFPDRVEVEMVSAKPQEYRITKEDNVVYVTFVK